VVGEAGGAAMVKIPARGAMGRGDRAQQVITGEEPREIGRAPDVATSRRVRGRFDRRGRRHKRGANRSELGAKRPMAREIVDGVSNSGAAK